MHGMSFHFGFGETILFDGWKTTDLNGIIGSMVGIAIMGMIYEALKNYREYLNVTSALHNVHGSQSRVERMFSAVHIVQTALQAVQVVLGYFLMFIFMTYNVYLCIAVLVGSVLGYFLFAWKSSRCDISECCL
ncbi:high affinity copper uptake protein 1-like [Phymastichus coffea]|uniref:high affinity copper uptake protein 1-like n=1 Tax=Phymastichus coffea TaxID=108790 RepID=UPI00273C3A50|nr:high affinity copper uptake protein 1-like [Phymastichus coffea]